MIRENTEGEYAGLGGHNLSPRERQRSRPAVRAVHRGGLRADHPFAFDLARTRTVKKVSSVTKSNAQQYGMVLWDEVFKRVALDYPDVESESVLVDAMSAKFVLHPEDLSVVVASNLNADILSDLGSALAGSLGLAASANHNPERRFPSMFEPVHGSAPDIAGQGVSNPIGAIASAALMLDHFGLPAEAGASRRRSKPPPAVVFPPATSAARRTPTRSPTRSSHALTTRPSHRPDPIHP